MTTEQYITLISLVFIAASNLFALLQNVEQFKAATIERKKINQAIRALIEALEKLED